jgi:hypothetical protein
VVGGRGECREAGQGTEGHERSLPSGLVVVGTGSLLHFLPGIEYLDGDSARISKTRPRWPLFLKDVLRDYRTADSTHLAADSAITLSSSEL